MASKYFAIDIARDSQNAFAMFKGQMEYRDAEVKKVQVLIEKNIHERISVDELSDFVVVGRRSLKHRFKRVTKNSILEYSQRVKIEGAKRSFEASRKNANEVMFDVGYTGTKAFRAIFKKVAGLTPVEYRNKYFKQDTNMARM